MTTVNQRRCLPVFEVPAGRAGSKTTLVVIYIGLSKTRERAHNTEIIRHCRGGDLIPGSLGAMAVKNPNRWTAFSVDRNRNAEKTLLQKENSFAGDIRKSLKGRFDDEIGND